MWLPKLETTEVERAIKCCFPQGMLATSIPAAKGPSARPKSSREFSYTLRATTVKRFYILAMRLGVTERGQGFFLSGVPYFFLFLLPFALRHFHVS